jgi:hypothetical protein
VASNTALNTTGDVRNDGSPDTAYHPTTHRPYVVWAYDNGPDRDIAFSRWADDGWTAEEFLTAGTEDELDPRVFVGPGGDVHVVWWVDGPTPYVLMTSRATHLDGWSTPVRVSPSGEMARRPTVAVHQGVVRVAYERETSNEPTVSRELVVRRLDADRGFVDEHALAVPTLNRLDPVLHVESGRLWMDWKHSDSRFGSTERITAGWTAPALHTWSDPSWVGIESARRSIRRNLLAGPGLSDVGN